MAYPNVITEKNVGELLLRKEFAQLRFNPSQLGSESKAGEGATNPSFIDELLQREGALMLRTHQLFARNLENPNTPYTSIFFEHATGTGKTKLACGAAVQFIRQYLQNATGPTSETPYVFIIGFSKAIFQRELLRHPEFGFVSKQEIIEFNRLKHLAEYGSKADHEIFTEFEARLKRKLIKRETGGLFKFFGYEEFFNRLFIFNDQLAAESARATAERARAKAREEESGSASEIKEEVVAELERGERGEDAILHDLRSGAISLNLELLDIMANGFVICDEIHNVYNSQEMNNYGIALRVLFNIFDMPELMSRIVNITGKTKSGEDRIERFKNSRLWRMFLSATPLSSSPTTVVDLLNLVVPLSQLPGHRKLVKDDFFIDNRNLKPGALERIAKLSVGHISFLRDYNPRFFPERIIDGEPIVIPHDLLGERLATYHSKEVPYLRFIRCPMSKLHQHTYDAVYQGSLPPDGYSLLDMVFPNPADPKIGLFRSKEVKYALSHAEQAWKDEQHIDIMRDDVTGTAIITGEFLKMPRLREFSNKYARMMEDVIDNLVHDKGKILISHQYVHMSGALLIQEILRQNGLVDEYTTPAEDTLCARCGLSMGAHKKGAGEHEHDYTPARFLVYHGELDKSTQERLLEKFRGNDNANGYLFRILVGAKVVNEGVDLNAVRQLYVMSVPSDISTLLQIIGRAVRTNSHVMLPPDKRQVHVRIYTSRLRENEAKGLAHEEHRYFEKSQDYLVIQEIEKVWHETAIDAPLNRDVIFPTLTHHKGAKMDELGALYFEPADIFGKKWREVWQGQRQITPKDIDNSTFTPFHSDEEVQLMLYIIKRLFIEQSPAWTYDELWQMVRRPPFHVYVDTSLFEEENFLLALYSLLGNNQLEGHAVDTYAQEAHRLLHNVNRLFDEYDKEILDNRVIYLPPYFVLFPVVENVVMAESIIGSNVNSLYTIDVDLENWQRPHEALRNTSMPITKYLRTSNISYNQMKFKFYQQFRDTAVSALPSTVEIYDLDFHIHLVQDAITYAFYVLTTDPSEVRFSELHDFYFKMLYFYDQLDLLMFAADLEGTKYLEPYKKYVREADLSFSMAEYDEEGKKVISKIALTKEDFHYNAFLMSSLYKTGVPSKFNLGRLNAFLGKKEGKVRVKLADMMIEKQVKRTTHVRPIFSNMLPVGHFLSSSNDNARAIPTVYMPGEEVVETRGVRHSVWNALPEFSKVYALPQDVENDLIIGYYEKNPGSIEVRFKLRPPEHKIVQYEDTRMIERGAACNTRNKQNLKGIMEMLGLAYEEEENIKTICNRIKMELIGREMQERRRFRHDKNKEKRVRWFYLHFE